MKTLDNFNRWFNSPVVSEKDKEILRTMSKSQIDDAFFKDIDFGTAGMRGILGPGTNRLNDFTVRKATVGLAIYLLDKFPNASKNGVVISHDNRHQSRSFTLLTAKILSEFGIKTYIFDSLRPTPELSFAVRYLKCDAGVMITASHNPKEYNGYKVYDEHGCQLVPEKIEPLLDIIRELPNELDVAYTPVKNPAKIITIDKKLDDDYLALVEDLQLNRDLDKSKFKIVFTPNHGTSYVNAMRLFKDIGYNVYPVESQCDPDPDFSGTESPNPEDIRSYTKALELAKEVDADLVLMTDPDGDRVGLAYKDKKGNYIIPTGNESAALLLDYVLKTRVEHGTLPHDAIMINTVVTSNLGQKIAESYGVKVEQFLTGFKFIGDHIHYLIHSNEGTFVFGYEESNGALLGTFARDKDGLQAMTLYAEMTLYYLSIGKTLDEVQDELGKKFGYHEDKTYSLHFEGSAGFRKMNDLMNNLHEHHFKEFDNQKVVRFDDYIDGISYREDGEYPIDLPKNQMVKFFLEDGTSIAIRPSGTEPKVKFYIGAVDHNPIKAKERVVSLYDDIRNKLGL